MELSLVIPAFNEATKILMDLKAVTDFLSMRTKSEVKTLSEVIIVDDGSRDSTRAAVQNYIDQHTFENIQLRLLSYSENRGKGFAVRFGVKHAQGKIVAFMDSGLCVPLRFLDDGIKQLASGFDFAIASRRLPHSEIKQHQPLYRRWGSRVFWILMRLGMGIEVSDTQCGFKLYRGIVARDIFSRLRTDGFMFDIEALRIAKTLGYKGTEFPVQWSNDKDTRYSPFWGTLRNFKELSLIRLHSPIRGSK